MIIKGKKDQEELDDSYIGRAAGLAETYLTGKRWGLSGNALDHAMQMAFFVSRVSQQKEVLAAAWLTSAVKNSSLPLAEVSNQFDFILSGLLRVTAFDQGVTPEGKEKMKAIFSKASQDIQNIKLAELISNTQHYLLTDWVMARDYVVNFKELLEVMTEADTSMIEMAKAQLVRANFYLDEVIGNAGQDTPMLSSGHPSTLGAYKMLTTLQFGPESPAVWFLTDKIAQSPNGVGEVVLQAESQMIYLLQEIHSGTFSSEDTDDGAKKIH